MIGTEQIQRRRLRWFRHLCQVDESWIPCQLLWKVQPDGWKIFSKRTEENVVKIDQIRRKERAIGPAQNQRSEPEKLETTRGECSEL